MTGNMVRLGDSDDRKRLATYIGTDIVAVAGAAVWLAVLRLTIVPNAWVVLLVIELLGATAGLYLATSLVRSDRYGTAVAIFAAANWGLAVSIAAISPFAPTVLAPAILLPVMVAVQYLSRRHLSALLGGAVLVGAATGVGGSLPDVFGIYADSPRWINDALALVFVPAMSGLIALAAWQTHVALATKGEALHRSHTRLVAAADEVRHRIEQDLLKAPQRRLTAAVTSVRAARRAIAWRHAHAPDAVERVIAQLHLANAELRAVAHGIYAPELTEFGLAAALRATEMRSTVLNVSGLGRYPPEIENSIFFCCLEAWQNAITHAGADAHVNVTVQERNGLWFDVQDDGVGCAADALRTGPGFTTMTDRMGAIGGSVTFAAAQGSGVRVSGHVPAAVLIDPSAAQTMPTTSVAVRALASVWRFIARPWGNANEIPTGPQDTAVGIQTLWAVALVTGAMTVGYAVAQPAWWLADLAATSGSVLLLRRIRRRLAQHGDHGRAATTTTTFWAYAVVVTLLAPGLLPYSSVMVVMPVVFAAARLQRRPFMLMLCAMAAVAVLITVVGRFPPAGYLESPTHPLAHSIAFVALLTIGAAVPSLLAWQNHAALTRRVEALQLACEALITATDFERQQIERDLHDCAQQRLVAAALRARLAHRLLTTQPERADNILAELVADLREASDELYDLTRGIHAPRLAGHGLEAALRSAAIRAPLPTLVTADGLVRYDQETETNVYACCVEALQNAIKHAGDGATVTIHLSGHNGLSFDIRDDGAGCGLDQIIDGHGWQNMHARLASIGGTLVVQAKPAVGVHIHGYIASPTTLDPPLAVSRLGRDTAQ
jgi:signal transduction histidine kinase